ncbi:MAG TPA: metallophosphoesterase [Kofleriaceae bacterium]|nr:metallophosphoesterase [Kofleriaceae bacterium]
MRAVFVAIAATAAVACVVSAAAQPEGDDDEEGAGAGSASGSAASGAGAGAADALTLLARTTPLVVRWTDAPAVTAQLGPVIFGELDRARDAKVVVPSLVGDAPADFPSPAWPLALDGIRAAGPFGTGDDCPCTTRIGDLVDGKRIAAIYGLGTFVVPAAAADLRVLEIRARYKDGIALWLNGVPVARRNLATAGPTLRLAERLHGPEWETFFVPVTPGLLRAGENVLAVAVHPTGGSRAPFLELEVLARRGSRVVRGPLVQRVGDTSATVVVETDLPAKAELAWGTTTALGQRAAAAVDGGGRRHRFELSGLPVDAAVHYQITVDGVAGAARAFATAPRAGDVVRFAVYGDVRGGHSTHAKLIGAMAAEAPDLVLASGDLVLRGTDEADWQRFFEVTASLMASTPFYSCVGNHDVGKAGDLARRFSDIFALPPGPPDRPAGGGWYSFDVAGVHVVMLDSNSYEDAAQRRWLDEDLAAARKAKARAIFAVTHDGPFARGLHGGNSIAAKEYVPIMVRHGVTLVISGHDHIYQRGRQGDLDYVVSGGGGAPLYRISCGVKGRRACKTDDGMLHVAREHHYLMVSVYPSHVELCPKLVDGTPLEPCTTYKLPRR